MKGTPQATCNHGYDMGVCGMKQNCTCALQLCSSPLRQPQNLQKTYCDVRSQCIRHIQISFHKMGHLFVVLCFIFQGVIR